MSPEEIESGESGIPIVPPRPGHAEGLAGLLRSSVREAPVGSDYPPHGQLREAQRASARLLGRSVSAVWVAETHMGKMVDYAGIYCHPRVADIPVLVPGNRRRRGLARRLVDNVFECLPQEMEVEA